MKLNSHLKSQGGFALTEILVAVGLLGIVGMMGASILHSQVKSTQGVIDRLEDESDAHSAIHDLTKELKNSHIMRLGLANCGVNGGYISTAAYQDASQTINVAATGSSFSFLYSSSAGFAATNPQTTADLFVSDTSLYPVGSLILLIASNAQRVGVSAPSSFFYVESVNRPLSAINIIPANINSSGTACTSSASVISKENILQNSTFVIHRAHIVSYRSLNGRLLKSRWPEDGATAAVPTRMIVDNFVSLRIENSWQSYLSASEAALSVNREKAKKHGRYEAEVTMVADFRDTAGALEKSRNTLLTQSSYDLPSSSRVNVDAQTSPPTLSKIFPSCSITASQVVGMVRLPDDALFANSTQYLITGAVSDDVLASITTNFVPIGLAPNEGRINCFNVKNIPGNGQLNGYGTSASITLNKTGNNYESYICAVSRRVQIDASMGYTDPGRGKTMNTPCSGITIDAPRAFRFSGTERPRCYSDSGRIEFGDPLIEDVQNNPRPGPALYTGATSCLWDDSPDGIGEPCTQPDRFGRSRLLSVKILPGGTTINGGGSLDLRCN